MLFSTTFIIRQNFALASINLITCHEQFFLHHIMNVGPTCCFYALYWAHFDQDFYIVHHSPYLSCNIFACPVLSWQECHRISLFIVFDMIQCTYLICNRKDEHFVTFYFYNCRVYVDKKVCFNHILSKFYIENILKNPYVKEKFVSDLQSQVSGFLQVPQFPPQIKLGATI